MDVRKRLVGLFLMLALFVPQQVWAEEGGIVAEETIDTVVHRIRDKIEPDPSQPRFLVTLPRFGFRLDL